jgi:hypothetical protein
MDFYRQSNGNLQRDCKECWKAYVRANRLVKIDQYREYERGRANAPHRLQARQEYARTDGGKRAANRAKRTFLDRYPAKRAAHVATGNAIRDGRLVREPCEVCGARAQAHHDDYAKPLEVRWLCPMHHAEWHKHNTPLNGDVPKAA